MGWFTAWLGYGIGRGVAGAVLGEDGRRAPGGPIRAMTEEQIRADEKRYAEDEKRLDEAEARAKKK